MHGNVINPFFDFSLTFFLPKKNSAGVPHHGERRLFFCSLGLMKTKKGCYYSNIYFFLFEKSGQQLKPALALSVDKSPRPGARICRSGLLRISFGLWSSSSSFSWRDQPAQTWCHSKSAQAEVLHPKNWHAKPAGKWVWSVLLESCERIDLTMNVFGFSMASYWASSPERSWFWFSKNSSQFFWPTSHNLISEGKSAKYGVVTAPVSLLQDVRIRFLTCEPDLDWVLYCFYIVWFLCDLIHLHGGLTLAPKLFF